MSGRYIEPLLFPETDDFHASVVYWSGGVIRLVSLEPDGPGVGEHVVGNVDAGFARELFERARAAPPEDPFDVILAAQKAVSEG